MKKKESSLPVLFPNAAGIDISSREHFVAVNPAACENPIRSFGAFTEDLHAIAHWLAECKVETVAMEATGIYWVSLYLILEEAGFDVMLVTAKHVKNVRGKKSDVSDAEWIRQLHSCGLLSASFQPDSFTRTLRTYMRHRKNMVEMAATHVRMMQKALEQMNIKVHTVITDLTGKSGMAIVEAIIGGERDPEKLSEHCKKRIRSEKFPAIVKSLQGMWKEEHVFELSSNHALYLSYQQKIAECDAQIEKHVRSKTGTVADPSKKMKAKSNKNNLNFDANEILCDLTGVDLAQIYGITATNGLEILSEIGLDPTKWPTCKHFTSWLNLAPNNKISGGKVLTGRIPKKKNYAGQVFRMAAFAVQRSKNSLAMFYHRIKAKRGVKKAVVATARKIAVIFYKMMRDRVPFKPMIVEEYQNAFKNRQIRRIKRQAQTLGLQLVSV